MKKLLSVILVFVLVLSITPSSFANTDTLADWNIRITVPDGKTAVLKGSEYYIYGQQEGSIPYVMLRPYRYDDPEEFITDFTEYMRGQYSDLTVTSPATRKTIGNKRCWEIDYGYTVSGYDVRDRRMVFTVDGLTYMFASKEIVSNGMTIGSMLDDVVADCELLGPGAESVMVEGEPAAAEKTISPAYVYYDKNGLPKYWLDFTGSAADNLVLHCYFFTDSWYESWYILDFNSSVANSHQDTYRIENVYDSRGTDVSNWFKTVSLTINGVSVSLYMERNPSTLAGGPDSTILDGLYEMTPEMAGIVYEYTEDRELKSWLVLNSGNAELHFADGRIWYLEPAAGDGNTVNIARIVSQTGEEVPFQSMAVTYVQGAMMISAEAGEALSGVFLYSPRVFLQRDDCSASEIGRMAQMYYYRHHNFYPPVADVEPNGDGTFSVHLYEIVNNGDGTYHTATSAWYTVDASGIGADDLFGDPVDLRM